MMHGLFARAFVRSTEDPEKVMRALLNVVPLPRERVRVEEHRGIYGNLFWSLLLEGGRKEALKTWAHIWNHMEPEDREFLRKRVEDFVDEWGQLHLRFNKQEALQGRLVMGRSGVIKVVFKLEAYPAKPSVFLRVARRLVDEEVLRSLKGKARR